MRRAVRLAPARVKVSTTASPGVRALTAVRRAALSGTALPSTAVTTSPGCSRPLAGAPWRTDATTTSVAMGMFSCRRAADVAASWDVVMAWVLAASTSSSDLSAG